MGDALQIRGVVGQIKWSYYNAAAIHGYTVRRDKTSHQWSMTGTVVASDAFKLSQRPLMFVAPHKRGAWKWEIRSLEIQAGTVRATLSDPQE